jgi:hypothetical protein
MTEKGTVPDADDRYLTFRRKKQKQSLPERMETLFLFSASRKPLADFSPAPSSPVPAKFRR